MKTRKKRIYFETEETETVVKKKKGWIEIELDYTQFYHNIAPFILNLKDKWSINYLLWIIPKCNDENMIPHSSMIIKEFLKYLSQNKIEKIPSEKTIRDCITELVKNKIFLKHGNSCYQLNPLILWSVDTEKRIEHLKELGKYQDFDLIEEPEVKYISKND
jgi:hypothetical protein